MSNTVFKFIRLIFVYFVVSTASSIALMRSHFHERYCRTIASDDDGTIQLGTVFNFSELHFTSVYLLYGRAVFFGHLDFLLLSQDITFSWWHFGKPDAVHGRRRAAVAQFVSTL